MQLSFLIGILFFVLFLSHYALATEHAMTAESIIQEHSQIKHPQMKNFKGPVLAYVTPWNPKGYDIAKQMPGKFSYISPCWFEILPTADSVKLNGEHDVDKGWVKEIRSNAKSQNVSTPLILPRVLLDQQKNVYRPKHFEEITKILTKLVKKFSFDGIVLDIGYSNHQIEHDEKVEFLKNLASELRDSRKRLIVVVPPVNANLWSGKDISELITAVDGFSVMTYDYSSKPGPNSPLNWFTSNVIRYIAPTMRDDPTKTAKLFLGMNFYGYDFNPNARDAVRGEVVVEILQKYSPTLHWNKNSHEHSFEYTEENGMEHIVFYPTPKSIEDRLAVATQMGVGISIWEIGQGLDYFYNQL